jgi:putative membrane protein
MTPVAPPPPAPATSLPKHFAQGLLMGGADIIPGVSGGTVALILGIYERLIDSIRGLATGIVAALRRDREATRTELGRVEWKLVLPLGVGIVTAVGIGSLVIAPLLERYPEQMRGVFFGMIAGSLIVPWRRVGRHDGVTTALMVAAVIVAAVLVGLPPREIAEPSLLLVMACAAVAICAMILPGVSGAFLLLVLGIYDATLHAISSLNMAYIGVFIVGAVLGLGVFSRVLSHLLHHHHDRTMAVLVGLMAGSLRALWPWQTETRGLLAPPAETGQVLVVTGLAVVAFVAVTALIRLGGSTPAQDPERDPSPQVRR